MSALRRVEMSRQGLMIPRVLELMTENVHEDNSAGKPPA
jgi:hypothetical protein